MLKSSPQTPGPDADSPLPPLCERLGQLRPSRELLDFYQQKISQFDGEQEALLQTLEKYRSVTDEQHKLQWELQQRETEGVELQKALSDMQVFLFQEREQSLRLYAENDRLKIRELQDRKKIQHLLALVGPDAGEVTYFHREPPHKVTVPEKSPEDHLNLRPPGKRPGPGSECGRRTRPAHQGTGGNPEQNRADKQVLLLQLEALQAQMEEQARLAKEQQEALLEERRLQEEERRARGSREEERSADLTHRLQGAQRLLYQSTRDLLALKFEWRAQEQSWAAEKDVLLVELDACRRRGGRAQAPDPPRGGRAQAADPPRGGRAQATDPPRGGRAQAADPPSGRSQREERRALQEELKEAQRLAEMFRAQCVAMETELSQTREEGAAGRELLTGRSHKMAARLQLVTQRYEALERRRRMEAQGFKADLRLLRQTLKDLENRLLKVTLGAAPHQDQDLAVLQEVKQTNTRTRQVQTQLQGLKAKIYGLENHLRFC